VVRDHSEDTVSLASKSPQDWANWRYSLEGFE
jgi:hypothetical protein